MGAVFVGEHITTEMVVAIKVLFVLNDPKQNSLEVLTEAKVAGRVRSENIVQVQDAGIDPETNMMYLVMELLEGKTLEELVESRGPLSPQEVVLYLRQVALGLDKAHHYKTSEGPQPIVHRDLKPENIFLTHRDDGSPLIKILDFGIAKVLSKGATKATQQLKGTPLYMAPEQLSLSGVSPATDIWALGLITFFLLTRLWARRRRCCRASLARREKADRSRGYQRWVCVLRKGARPIQTPTYADQPRRLYGTAGEASVRVG